MTQPSVAEVPTPAPVAALFPHPHGNEPIRAELFGAEHLDTHARQLASCAAVAPVVAGQALLARFRRNSRALRAAHRFISEAYRRGESFGSDAEWLLDNFHIVSDALNEVRTDLPRGYYRLLPKLASGPLTGFPRVYALALELIAHCDSCLDEANITRFVQAYQTVTPLTIGEVWAIPIMLRLVVIENLRRLAEEVVHSHQQRHEAKAWAAPFLESGSRDSQAGAHPIPKSSRRRPPACTDPFIVHLLDLLREHGSARVQGIEWLESLVANRGETPTDILRREQQRQAANQVSIGNCVTSLRLLSALDWTTFFERTSLVEALLRDDPARVYARQDFPTRDRYRRVVEKLARGSGQSELEVTREVLALAGRTEGANAPQDHVGYYLIDRGRQELEACLRYRLALLDRVRKFLLVHPQAIYFGGLAIVTAGLLSVAAIYGIRSSATSAAAGWCVLVVLATLLPASELAIGLVNYLITLAVPPRVLPKLAFKEGTPADCATFVVIPCMLVQAESASALLQRLEIHYLSNPDPQLRFALLTDFADAPAEQMPEDDRYVRAAVEGIKVLNDRYCAGQPERFFVCHRRRIWNPVQGCWMGWERKRGKLVEFNRLLRGDRTTSFAVVSSGLDRLPRIRFVITLDADTKLPRETAQRLLATAAHPLNQPYFGAEQGRVIRGYGVLQPRVSVTLTGAGKSLFARIYSGSAGLDPYTTAVSDTYQDLFGIGSFTGKGIYDVDAFEAAVGHTFPDNQILSHDLIEGNYARCGLVTDVELLDAFPAQYGAYALREHRWARGDWQILPWLFPQVPAPPEPPGTGNDSSPSNVRPERHTRRNTLPAVERWKIFDNLRRSLLPPALIVLLVLGWLVLPGSSWFWTGAALVVLGWPLLLQLATGTLQFLHGLVRHLRIGGLPGNVGPTAGQVILGIVFLVDQSRLMLDAVVRTVIRLAITRRHLLEWETAAATERRLGTSLPALCRSMWLAPALTVLLGLAVVLLRTEALPAATPLLAAWFLSPAVAFWVSRPRRPAMPELTPEDCLQLHRLARKTWNFFETFVQEEDHWLPPDNYQEEPKSQVAHRTSPTNIGLYLLSNLAAHDFGYLSLPAMLERLEKTFATLESMERFQGHFYNWYDTRTLRPLQPGYISTVDSGNLLGCLIALQHGLEEQAKEPIPSSSWREGLTDVVQLAAQAFRSLELPGHGPESEAIRDLERLLQELEQQLQEAVIDALEAYAWLERLHAKVQPLHEHIGRLADLIREPPEELQHWAERFAGQVADRREELAGLLPWLEALPTSPEEFTDVAIEPGSEQFERWRQLRRLLVHPTNIDQIQGHTPQILAELAALADQWPTPAGRKWLASLVPAVRRSTASELKKRCRRLADQTQSLAAAMEFKILYNQGRHLFSIGYNLSMGRLDNAHYDLLASEARLTSFLAIARGEAPKRHWFQLGRPLTRAAGSVALLSWGGTMFEYLMPRLLLQSFPSTLLDESDQAAVARQIQYGRQVHVPWGISESAFNALDAELNYQYQAFGVPGLGLKRGLARDLVIAPYATVLALAVCPHAASRNLQRLAQEGVEATYGFYEAVDFTRERLPAERRAVIVKCFMAHHQGMSLLALANCLLHNIMPRRFHAEPMVRATELLLQERVPHEMPLTEPHRDEVALPHSTQDNVYLLSRRLTTPHTAHPRTHLLSSDRYSLMLTNAGSSRSLSRGLEVTRWREDRTRDDWGQFCYVRDLRTGRFWSAGYQPVCRTPEEYEVVFSTDKAEFRRLDQGIETHLEIAVSPENHAEIRRLTLTNHHPRTQELEVTSYVEIVLSPPGADLAHPAFGKLFLETEFVAAQEALLCRRRPREPNQKPLWAVHVVAVDGPALGTVQYETDRARFLGRGRTPAQPAALDRGTRLSATIGAVLDPILSLRRQVRIAPGRSVSIAFTTAVAETREEALALADQYHDFHGIMRGFELAWAQSQVELRHLHLSAEDAHLYQRLAAHILYVGSALRAPDSVLKANQQGQSALWRYGISGDRPIVLVRIAEMEELPLVRQLLTAHAYWRLKGLEVDMVLLNEQRTGYFEELHQELQNLVRGSDDRGLLDKPGGVFVRKAAQIPREDQILLQAAAHCVLAGNQGSLANQIDRPVLASQVREGKRGVVTRVAPLNDKTLRAGPGQENLPPSGTVSPAGNNLLFDNGIGGFRADAPEYVLRRLRKPSAKQERNDGRTSTSSSGPDGNLPPAPWINVVANPGIGFLISESGSGYTWAGNSQTNRLTPWSNDPVSDPPGEVVYLRDEATGEVWTPTPLPAAAAEPYLVRHGQGYTVFEHTSHGLKQELTLFVPPNDPIKLISLQVRNLARRPRRLSITFYAEWVLGTVRNQAVLHALTEVDPATGAIVARNPFNADFPSAVAFADVNLRPRTLTADRMEFLGRNGSLAAPVGLEGELSGATGATLDPCAALQVRLDLKPSQEETVTFFLGQAGGIEEVHQLLQEYHQPGRIAKTLAEAKDIWERVLNVVQVQTPNRALDLLFNRWLLYQVLSCRFWGRSAFYQSGGAYGFRDQLQDVMALVWAAPHITRDHLLRAASRQFREGDVQHWWHPPRGAGVRTHISDDFLWLPFAVSYYVKTTGDSSVLEERVPFLQAPPIPPGQDEDYRVPDVSEETASLYEHCLRAVDHGLRFGAHGLPLMGAGDWNDGMNRVGRAGQGESVWNGWFLLTILPDFAALAEARGEAERARSYREQAERLCVALEEHAWDGQWYRRAYFDDGTPLGSAQNDECRIDSLAQSWAVISGGATADRGQQALAAAEQHLVKQADRLILLFTPPFNRSKLEPGYVKGYVPGIRENGGQYTHGATWVVQAAALLGQGTRAMELFDLLNPIHHTSSAADVERYRVEPYVLAGDVYSQPPHTGRGGWTWYTGSAGWLYRIALETLLGFQLRGTRLTLNPCIPHHWPGFDITYRYRSATYVLRVENPNGVEHGVRQVTLDGKELADRAVDLADDRQTHEVRVVMG
ncbi:MAG TPA: glucoamylase family protein [Gemmataceae bacterium]|nr:glucoamylase family protein [Gemmataceae bacterium]